MCVALCVGSHGGYSLRTATDHCLSIWNYSPIVYSIHRGQVTNLIK